MTRPSPLTIPYRLAEIAAHLADAQGHAAAIAWAAVRNSDTRTAAEALQIVLDAAHDKYRRLEIDHACDTAIAALGPLRSDDTIEAALLANDPDYAERQRWNAANRAIAAQGVG